MYRRFLVFTSKLLISALRLVGKNGSALPGLVIERLCPRFLELTLMPVEKQVVLVTGTNGKTTTTKMLVAGLRGAGARVVTNGTGSNMTRGLIAAVVDDMSYLGSLKKTDWFVFEMDEAYAPRFTANLSPRMVIALNVLRDQLDRYGEIDTTAQMIGAAARKSDFFTYNALDPLLREQAKASSCAISFSVDVGLLGHVSNEQTIHGAKVVAPPSSSTADVRLTGTRATGTHQYLRLQSKNTTTINADNAYELIIPVLGFHNALNATAVVAALEQLVGRDINEALTAIADMPTPFGRGEQLAIGSKQITVALVKNPSGFTSNLETFAKQARPDAILFVVNDKLADGRDVSWLWDVDFKPYITDHQKLYASGIRAYDMGLRLKHDNFDVKISTDTTRVVSELINGSYTSILIIPTYTALFEVRDCLGKYTEVPRIW